MVTERDMFQLVGVNVTDAGVLETDGSLLPREILTCTFVVGFLAKRSKTTALAPSPMSSWFAETTMACFTVPV